MSELFIKNHLIKSYKPIICVPVIGTTKEEVFSQASNYIAARIDMIEWRVDYLQDYRDQENILSILDMLKNICEEAILVVTMRTVPEGGLAELREEEIQPILEAIAASGCADIIDIEFDRYRDPAAIIAKLKSYGTVVLSSKHVLTGTPTVADMTSLLNHMAAEGSDIVKLATIPHSTADVLDLLQVTNAFATDEEHPPVISMAMGSQGVLTRVCGEIFGSCVTFGAIGKGSAPGQVQCDELRNVMQFFHESMV